MNGLPTNTVGSDLKEALDGAVRIVRAAGEIAASFEKLGRLRRPIRFIRPQSGPDDVAAIIDHTLLRADASEEEVLRLCAEAVECRFGAVCVNSSNVEIAARGLAGTPVIPVSTVGFPLGAASVFSKAAEAAEAAANGAEELDMVINLGLLKSGRFSETMLDVAAVVIAAGGRPVKVILETSLLNEGEKTAGCLLARAAGASFVKTSTGFSGGGATDGDVRLLRRTVGPSMGVKASGGIRSAADLKKMLAAGASRIGSSNSVKIIGEFGR